MDSGLQSESKSTSGFLFCFVSLWYWSVNSGLQAFWQVFYHLSLSTSPHFCCFKAVYLVIIGYGSPRNLTQNYVAESLRDTRHSGSHL
jgi:hypothetical protein